MQPKVSTINKTVKLKPKPKEKTNVNIDIINFLARNFKKVRIGMENDENYENDELVKKIVERLRSIDDTEYAHATYTKKSMNEFKDFFETKDVYFEEYTKRILEQVLTNIERKTEPKRYNYVLQLISCKINEPACDDDVRDKIIPSPRRTSRGGKKKMKRTKKRNYLER